MNKNQYAAAWDEIERRTAIVNTAPQPRRTVDAERRLARLAKLIEDWNKDFCYEHGDACQDKAACLAREIIERRIAWD